MCFEWLEIYKQNDNDILCCFFLSVNERQLILYGNKIAFGSFKRANYD